MRIDKRDVRGDGLVGVLCSPEGGPGPGVLVLGGAEGGLHERDAEAFAAAGFTALALAYFGAPGLPAGLVEIPLEYFGRGLDLLAAAASPAGLAVVGGSRGGEAALLVGSTDERVRAVVCVAGGALLTQGIDYRLPTFLDIIAQPTASWTLGGKTLPYVPNVVPDELRRMVAEGEPIPLILAFPPVPEDRGVLEEVSIKVERIRGPVLLISGELDPSPAVAYSQAGADRLAARGHRYPFAHHILPGVGHPIAGAPGPPFTTTLGPGPGVTFDMGATPEANTAGRERAWALTLDFLRAHLT